MCMLVSPEKNAFEFGFLPGQKVADFGSGSGHYALALSRLVGEAGRVYAIDLKEEALVRLANLSLKEGKDNIDVVLADVERSIPLKDRILDGVLFSNILSQLANPDRAVGEASRLLHAGLAVVIESKDKISPERIKEIFTEKGFEFKREFEAGDHFAGLIFKK